MSFAYAIAAAVGTSLLTLALLAHGWHGLLFLPLIYLIMLGVLAAFEGF